MLDTFPVSCDLSAFNLQNNIEDLLTTDNKVRQRGSHHDKLWNQLHICLSLTGNIIGGDLIDSMRFEVLKSRCRVVIKNDFFLLSFKTAHIFDDRHVEGLGLGRKRNKKEVWDWFHCKYVKLHPYDLIETNDNFARCVHFYPSFRGSRCKDAVVVSSMTDTQLNDPNYSDTIVGIKVREIMSESGFKSSNKAFVLEGHKRDVVYKMPERDNKGNVIFHYEQPEELMTTHVYHNNWKEYRTLFGRQHTR